MKEGDLDLKRYANTVLLKRNIKNYLNFKWISFLWELDGKRLTRKDFDDLVFRFVPIRAIWYN